VSSARTPLAELLADLVRVLGNLRVRWYLFGAQAAVLHGVTRLTADVDVTVALGARRIADLVTASTQAGFDPRIADVEEFAERTRVVPLVHQRTRMPVDVVLAGPGLEELFLSRAREYVIGGVPVVVAAAEDLVAMKLLAGRPKDLDDAAVIVRTRGGELRIETIRETLRTLEQALDRSDLVPALERLLDALPRA